METIVILVLRLSEREPTISETMLVELLERIRLCVSVVISKMCTWHNKKHRTCVLFEITSHIHTDDDKKQKNASAQNRNSVALACLSPPYGAMWVIELWLQRCSLLLYICALISRSTFDLGHAAQNAIFAVYRMKCVWFRSDCSVACAIALFYGVLYPCCSNLGDGLCKKVLLAQWDHLT